MTNCICKVRITETRVYLWNDRVRGRIGSKACILGLGHSCDIYTNREALKSLLNTPQVD